MASTKTSRGGGPSAICTRCGRANTRGGRTRICEKCFKESPKKSTRLPEPPATKVCAFCREEKQSQHFYKNAARADWLSTYCRDCHKIKEKRAYDNDKDKGKDYRLWNRYNISLEEYNQILESQNYKCALCPKLHSDTKPLNVDHSHEEPSIVRGLLCITCNQRKLGSLRLEEVRAILDYLEQPPATLLIGHRLVPVGKEKPRRQRKRKYKHYKGQKSG